MQDINQSIQSKLALEIAQLNLDKATLQAQVEQLQAKVKELEEQTQVGNNKDNQTNKQK